MKDVLNALVASLDKSRNLRLHSIETDGKCVRFVLTDEAGVKVHHHRSAASVDAWLREHGAD